MDRFEVSAKTDGGRWRAGRQWFRKPTPVARDELADEQWERLEADPLIAVVPEGANPAPAGERPTRAERIRAAAETLRAGGDPGHFNRGGEPYVDALRAASGLKDVSADERDAAWRDVRGGPSGG